MAGDMPVHRLVGALALVVALAACSTSTGTRPSASPTGGASRGPNASPSSSASDLAAWRKCGATQVPPPDVLKTPTLLPKVVNRTSGAISDQEAIKWVTAYMREQQIERWAEVNTQDGLLTLGCLGSQDSTGQLFGAELQTSRMATTSGRRVEVNPATYVSVTVVKVPPDVKANVKGFDGTPSDFALLVEIQGPGGVNLVDSSGNKTPVSVIAPTDHFTKFLGGEYADGSLGSVWFQDSLFNCLTPWIRATCGL